MAIITIGKVDKKLFLVVIIIIVLIVEIIIKKQVPPNSYSGHLCALVDNIGQLAMGVVLYLIFKRKHKKIQEDKKDFKYVIYLFFLSAVQICYEIFYYYYVKDEKYYYFQNIKITANGVELILMSLGTAVFLKYEYYIHHIISMIIYCALGISNDFILGNYYKVNYTYVALYVITIVNEVLFYCNYKYMMDNLYYHYSEILMYTGIIGLIIKVPIYTGYIIYEYKNDIKGSIFDEISSYFINAGAVKIIFFQFIFFIFDSGIRLLLITLMVFYLLPNHKIIAEDFTSYVSIMLNESHSSKYYTLIPFVFQVLFLLFYFEIFEFNFCNLNQNTIKNIQARENVEKIFENKNNDVDSAIELNGQYIISNKKHGRFNEERSRINSVYKNDENSIL